MPTLAELLTAPTKAGLEQKMISRLQRAGFPTTDWAPGGPERTFVAMFVEALLDAGADSIPEIASGGLVDLASGDWLRLYSRDMYQNDWIEATRTVGTVELACAAGSGPYTITASDHWFRSAAGLRYRNTTGGTLRAPGFSVVTHTGTGTGTVTISGTGGNDTGLSVVIRIVAGGVLGVGTFQWSNDGGDTYDATTTIPGGGSYTETASGITVIFAGTFDTADTYTFESYGVLDVTVESEFPVDTDAGLPYNDPSDTGITVMVTPLPGVTVTNPAPHFSGVTQTGSGVGTVKPSTIDGVDDYDWRVKITFDGVLGTAKFRVSTDGGTSYGSEETLAASGIYGPDGDNLKLTFKDNGGSPAFITNDLYAFTSPGSWITTQGTDEEDDDELRTRDKARWPMLSLVPTLAVYEQWARNASAQVTQVLAVTSTTINCLVNIYLAGSGRVVGSDVVNAVKGYINARKPETDRIEVASATGTAVTLAGTVTVRAAALTAAQTAAQANLQAYIAQVGIGGTVRLAQVIEEIMRIDGVIDFTSVTINAVAGNLALGSTNIATWAQLVTSAFTWTTV